MATGTLNRADLCQARGASPRLYLHRQTRPSVRWGYDFPLRDRLPSPAVAAQDRWAVSGVPHLTVMDPRRLRASGGWPLSEHLPHTHNSYTASPSST